MKRKFKNKLINLFILLMGLSVTTLSFSLNNTNYISNDTKKDKNLSKIIIRKKEILVGESNYITPIKISSENTNTYAFISDVIYLNKNEKIKIASAWTSSAGILKNIEAKPKEEKKTK
ncbi:hypothetical protein [[Mycoplasma] collis]|uniref:hypothetical protein n=1 Tax=[Mycoplasma] collis TaxID=2127 RepID=UPI00051ADFB4|nr:hypothetical protein [[Mycoplasma] collis]